MDISRNESLVPFPAASSCNFASNTSVQIKYYYKLKYPGLYSLSPKNVKELLDDEQEYSELQACVESFINHVTRSNSGNNSYSQGTCTEEDEMFDSSWDTSLANIGIKHFGKSSDLSQISAISTDFSAYDSVHSITVPLRTYEKKCRNKPYYQNRSGSLKQTNTDTASVAEVTKQMNGLAFDGKQLPSHSDTESFFQSKPR